MIKPSERDVSRCVYTVLTGGYEALNEQPVARRSSIPFICFTDDPGLVSETWRIRQLKPIFGMDRIRDQRTCKLRPHQFLPEFDLSLYIDNSLLLTVEPERIFDAADLSTGLCLPEHSFRDSVHDEFLAVAGEMLDEPARILEQLTHYKSEAPNILERRPFWSGMILRDHRDPTMAAAMEIWVAHVLRYSRRDQLSAWFAFERAGLRPSVLPIDNHRSRFHSWPHMPKRIVERRRWPAEAANDGADPRIWALEQRVATLQAQNEALRSSLTWRLMGPVRALGRRFPSLAGVARRFTNMKNSPRLPARGARSKAAATRKS
jgi:hypothetical protein